LTFQKSDSHAAPVGKIRDQFYGSRRSKILIVIVIVVVIVGIVITPIFFIVGIVVVEFIVLFFIVYRREIELHRIDRDHFQFNATFWTGDNFTNILEFFIDNGFAFRTVAQVYLQ
jgi:hypothetical protein